MNAQTFKLLNDYYRRKNDYYNIYQYKNGKDRQIQLREVNETREKVDGCCRWKDYPFRFKKYGTLQGQDRHLEK